MLLTLLEKNKDFVILQTKFGDQCNVPLDTFKTMTKKDFRNHPQIQDWAYQCNPTFFDLYRFRSSKPTPKPKKQQKPLCINEVFFGTDKKLRLKIEGFKNSVIISYELLEQNPGSLFINPEIIKESFNIERLTAHENNEKKRWDNVRERQENSQNPQKIKILKALDDATKTIPSKNEGLYEQYRKKFDTLLKKIEKDPALKKNIFIMKELDFYKEMAVKYKNER